MRRADRLYRLVDHLRGRRCVTAAQLAQWLEVSERTVYRDVKALMEAGVPIGSEAGKGYFIVEYENNWDNSVPDIKKCLEYFDIVTNEIL